LLADPHTKVVATLPTGPRNVGVTVAFDVAQQSPEALLPPLSPPTPRPARQLLETIFAAGIKLAFGVLDPLLAHPLTELVTIDHVTCRDAGVTVELDVVQKPMESLFPLFGERIPSPARQLLEPTFAVGIKPASVVEAALAGDPLTEVVAVELAGCGDAGVSVAFDKLFQ
jgi:hypothetical protein